MVLTHGLKGFVTTFEKQDSTMKTLAFIRHVIGTIALGHLVTLGAFAAEQDSGQDVLMRALRDELDRSMHMKLEGLEEPYFIQYSVVDQVVHTVYADTGAVFRSDGSRSRVFSSEVRVGSYELDNTNFGGGGRVGFRGRRGGRSNATRASLPVEDDYLALRRAIWLTTDNNYKRAVETLTRKRAYLEERNTPERPADFTKMESVQEIEPKAKFQFDRKKWESLLRELSGHVHHRFLPQDISLSLIVTVRNRYLVNSDGTQMRRGDIGTVLNVNLEIQADDGERISDERSYYVRTPDDLPEAKVIQTDLEKMAEQLNRTLAAPVLDNYLGPVLFENLAAAQVFHQLLGRGLAGSPSPAGGRRRGFGGSTSLDSYLGRRILPRSFQVYDSPQTESFPDTFLAGRYRYDEEGVESKRVDLVKNGILRQLVMSRTPTKEFSESTGHGRSTALGGSARAQIGCLFIESNDGVPLTELKHILLEEAEAQGLKFALKVTALGTSASGSAKDGMAFFGRFGRGPGGGLTEPLYAYKVYVEGGREELVRGCQFGQVTLRSLRDIIAASESQECYNQISSTGMTPPSSIIAPSVIFEELDLTKVEIERDKRPFLKAPGAR